MKEKNRYGKKITVLIRRHKYPMRIHRVVMKPGNFIIKECGCGKYFMFVSNDDFSQLCDYATPITKGFFNHLFHDYICGRTEYILSWDIEVIS